MATQGRAIGLSLTSGAMEDVMTQGLDRFGRWRYNSKLGFRFSALWLLLMVTPCSSFLSNFQSSINNEPRVRPFGSMTPFLHRECVGLDVNTPHVIFPFPLVEGHDIVAYELQNWQSLKQMILDCLNGINGTVFSV
ncbi:hypothetical protein VNO77_16048 [Canavalia gladiata]|uniref:Uncharacterized protein n=1 Tax=Canavalia gladiata TaxID=3824 RepID=A0AAN9M3G6_CANGL